MLENIAIKTVEREGLISYGDTIVIGLSGGADSVSLLMFLDSIRDKYGITIKTCHLNHCIRGESATRDEKFAEEISNKYNAEFHLKRVDVKRMAKELKLSEEEAGRIARYNFFNEIAGDSGKIATAHNSNDVVETMLMRLARGTSLSGLCSISYKRDNIIRPILDVERSQIEEYLKRHGQEFMTDETNLEQEYTRNKIRLSLIPYIKSNLNPNFVNTATNSIRSFREDFDFIESCVDNAYPECVKIKNKNNAEIDICVFSKLHISIRKRIIIRVLREVSGNWQVSTPSNLLDDVANFHKRSGGYTVEFEGRITVRKIRDKISVFVSQELEDKPKIDCKNIDFGTISIDSYKIDVTSDSSDFIVNNAYQFYVPIDIWNRCSFRKVIDGDKFKIDDHKHQGLRKVYSKASVPNDKNRYVLAIENEVIWIPGVQGYRPDIRSGEFVKLKIKNMDGQP